MARQNISAGQPLKCSPFRLDIIIDFIPIGRTNLLVEFVSFGLQMPKFVTKNTRLLSKPLYLKGLTSVVNKNRLVVAQSPTSVRLTFYGIDPVAVGSRFGME